MILEKRNDVSPYSQLKDKIKQVTIAIYDKKIEYNYFSICSKNVIIVNKMYNKAII